jgi:hypothetical protein
MGSIRYERAYYHCSSCRHGWFPTDEEFGVSARHQTPGAREVIALGGLLEPFEQDAQDVLPRLSGLRISASTVRRTTEEVGADVAQRRANGETFAADTTWSWQADATGQRTAYVSLDATGVPQQGPRGQKAEGRMPWVASVFNPQRAGEKKKSRRVCDTRYVAGLMSLPELAAQLRRECSAVGVSQADVVIGLTDGGNGLEDCLIDALGGIAQRMVWILDFYHASEHVLEFAKVWVPNDTDRKRQVDEWCHTLKHEGGAALLRALEALDLSSAAAATREAHRQVIGYFRNNLHRTDYPAYVAHGWQIGSGKIESACKTVVGRRLKGGGMRWRPYGTTAVCQLRALYLSQRCLWDNYWKRTTPA